MRADFVRFLDSDQECHGRNPGSTNSRNWPYSFMVPGLSEMHIPIPTSAHSRLYNTQNRPNYSSG